jgi:hypothetical protein
MRSARVPPVPPGRLARARRHADAVAEDLSRHGGTILESSLCPVAEWRLQKALLGGPPARDTRPSRSPDWVTAAILGVQARVSRETEGTPTSRGGAVDLSSMVHPAFRSSGLGVRRDGVAAQAVVPCWRARQACRTGFCTLHAAKATPGSHRGAGDGLRAGGPGPGRWSGRRPARRSRQRPPGPPGRAPGGGRAPVRAGRPGPPYAAPAALQMSLPSLTAPSGQR